MTIRLFAELRQSASDISPESTESLTRMRLCRSCANSCETRTLELGEKPRIPFLIFLLFLVGIVASLKSFSPHKRTSSPLSQRHADRLVASRCSKLWNSYESKTRRHPSTRS